MTFAPAAASAAAISAPIPLDAPVSSTVLPARFIIASGRHGTQMQQGTRLGTGRRMAAILRAHFRDAPDQFRIAARQALGIVADIVFETGAAMAAQLQAPAIDLQ